MPRLQKSILMTSQTNVTCPQFKEECSPTHSRTSYIRRLTEASPSSRRPRWKPGTPPASRNCNNTTRQVSVVTQSTLIVIIIIMIIIIIIIIKYDNDDNNHHHHHHHRRRRRIQRRNSRFFTISSLRREPYAQVVRAQSCANHVQHIERLSRATRRVTCHVVRRDSSAMKSDRVQIALVELYFAG